MADFSTLIASIEATIKENGVQAITGQVLQDELLLMVNAINQLKQDTLEGYAFYGEPLPNGATRVVTQNTFFLASAGTYTINGSTITITDSGISVIVYDCVNDEITTYQLFAYDANPTSGSGNAVTSGGVKSALDTKADKNGASPDLFAGFAGNLVDTRSAGTPQGPYAFRQSGGDGVDYMVRIKGKTEAFNQLVPANAISTQTVSGVTITNNGDGTYTLNGLASANVTFVLYSVQDSLGHTYLVKGTPKGGAANSTYWMRVGTYGGGFIASDEGDGAIAANASSGLRVEIMVASGYNANNLKFSPCIFDLTLEGLGLTTAAAFRTLHPLPYYNPMRKLINNAATGIKTTGFNQWDEVWELGSIFASNGQNGNSSTTIRSKNYIPIFPSTTYYVRSATTLACRRRFYDADKNYLGESTVIETNTNETFTTPAGAYFMRFYMVDTYGTTYNHDICINISDASRNGTYEPYWERTLALGLNSIPCHDENNNAVVVNGLDGVGTSYDEGVVENGMVTKIIKRRGRRAYQAGDESDATLMTDGTNTDYPLATPLTLTVDTPFPAFVEVDALGTQERLPADTADNPQGGFESDSNYSISVANLLRKLSE